MLLAEATIAIVLLLGLIVLLTSAYLDVVHGCLLMGGTICTAHNSFNFSLNEKSDSNHFLLCGL